MNFWYTNKKTFEMLFFNFPEYFLRLLLFYCPPFLLFFSLLVWMFFTLISQLFASHQRCRVLTFILKIGSRTWPRGCDLGLVAESSLEFPDWSEPWEQHAGNVSLTSFKVKLLINKIKLLTERWTRTCNSGDSTTAEL